MSTSKHILSDMIDIIRIRIRIRPKIWKQIWYRWYADPYLIRFHPCDASRLPSNFDGAFVHEINVEAWGFIVRDHEGQPVLCWCRQSCDDPWRSLAAAYLGISRIVLETGQLKQALSSSSMDLAIGGGLFRDHRDSLLDDFSCESIYNISWVWNWSVAHDIVRSGFGWDPGQSEVWTDDPLPEFVISLCAREFAEPQSINERP
jgi:hypothetical protein